MIRFLRRHSIDTVHLNNAVDGMRPAIAAAWALRLPVVAHARGASPSPSSAPFHIRSPRLWIAVSEYIAGTLRNAGVPQDRIRVVHDAINLAEFQEGEPPAGLRSELGVPDDARVFGIFGRIIEWKGIREFVLAAIRVLEDNPDAVALVVGDPSDGGHEYYDEVRTLAADSGVGDRIVFTGFRTDVADLMRLCDVVVHTSTEPEPFGMIIIEGMATGAPVVAANAGGPTEIISEGETGLLVDPTDDRAVAEAISTLLADPHRLHTMGRLAAERARAGYSADRYARDVEAVWDKLRQTETTAGVRTPPQPRAAGRDG